MPPVKQEVGARELKTRLGTYLKRVRAGATIIVTERGQPVAELRPIRSGATPEESRLEELIALGVLSRQRRTPLPEFEPVEVRGEPLSKTVVEDRDERF